MKLEQLIVFSLASVVCVLFGIISRLSDIKEELVKLNKNIKRLDDGM